ncbi:hypothetical protein HOF65_08745 [bacterium]|nr:hypothetical protein [bacterium]MBT3853961.1 hypothetical protein [bacterium]MBT4633285.1 hypothetical protein [bacterium]MBT5492012.1 hypothetical protein [bacterium]MBT6779463.1 hypothetical protein [bacterium]
MITVPSHKSHSKLSAFHILLSKNINLFPIEIYQKSGFKTFDTFIVKLFVLENHLYLAFTFACFSHEEIYELVVTFDVVSLS